MSAETRRRWRDYRTAAGRRPVKELIDGYRTPNGCCRCGDEGRSADGTAGRTASRGEIYEVRADGHRQTFRILFAPEGRRGQVLLALEGFSKTTQKTPPEKIRLAERRLKDWRTRGGAQSQR